MKSVPKVNPNGYFARDYESMDDAFVGVVPFYTEMQPEEEGNTHGSQIAGYVVGVPFPDGFAAYVTPDKSFCFDIEAWGAYQTTYAAAEEAFAKTLEDWDGEGDAPVFIPPEQPSDLWSEGMSAEEIAELTKPTEQPSEMEQLRERLAAAEARNEQLAQESNVNQMALMELHMMLLSLMPEPADV